MRKDQAELLLHALEMIAGTRQCLDNLMGDKDIAREAIAAWNRRPETKSDSSAILDQAEAPKADEWRYKDEHSGIWHYCEGYEPVNRKERQALYTAPVPAQAVVTDEMVTAAVRMMMRQQGNLQEIRERARDILIAALSHPNPTGAKE